MLKHLCVTAAAATLVLMPGAALTGNGQEKTGQVEQKLVNGKVVSPIFQETYGLLSLSSAQPAGGAFACSATLLTNDWAITAAHCFDPANIANPSTVTVTAKWTKPAMRRGAQIVTFGSGPDSAPWDIALIRLDSRIIWANSPDGFQQRVWLDGPYNPNLQSTRIELLGRGIYQFASGSGASAIPSQSDGQYRYGTALITRFEGQRYWYTGDKGAMIAGGDSGGASFAQIFGGRAITGVHSLCTAECLPGKVCDDADPWTWVTATPECGDAPIQPIWDQIRLTIGATRSPAPPADEVWVDFNFHGTTELGTFESPFNTLAEGAAGVRDGGTIKIKAGSTNEAVTITKRMRIEPHGGTVTVGQ